MALNRLVLAVASTLALGWTPLSQSVDKKNEYEAYAKQLEEEYKLPQGLLRAIAEVESSWRPWVRGAKGEYGLTQLKPATVVRIHPGASKGAPVDEKLKDPYFNLRIAAEYLVYIRAKRKLSDMATLACLYNAGDTAVWCSIDYLAKIDKASYNYRN